MAISSEARKDRIESVRGFVLIQSTLKAIIRSSKLEMDPNVMVEFMALNRFIEGEIDRLEADVEE